MRTLRVLVAFAAMGSVVAAAACSSSSDNGGGGGGGGTDSGIGTGTDGSTSGNDGGTTGNDGSTKVDAETPPTIAPAANDLKVYLGQIAQLDASPTIVNPSTVTVTYKWTVESAPAGSAITTPSLFNAGSAKPSFTPDVIGDYKLKVTISAGTATADKTVTVTAYEAQAMFFYTSDAGTKYGVRAAATVSDAGTHDLSCHVWDSGTSYDTLMPFEQVWSSDSWEAPAGFDSKVAYVQQIVRADAGQGYELDLVTTSSSCGTPPVKLDEFPSTANGSFMDPRISPNGARVAYIRKPTSPAWDRVMTVAADGTMPHTIGSFAVRTDGGPLPDGSVGTNNQMILSPQWMDDTHVGWLQFTTGAQWQVVVADDTDGAEGSVYMTCATETTGDKPIQFAFTKDGSVLVSQRSRFNDASGTLGAGDLLLFKPNATTKKCELVRNLTNLESDGSPNHSYATSFSVSPDGTQVAFVMFDGTVDAGAGFKAYSIWTASIDGLVPPGPVPGIPGRGVSEAFGSPMGPHWVAGGSKLVWPQEQRTVDAGNTGSSAIVIASPGGGDLRVIANTKNGQSLYGIGQGNACSIAAAGGSGIVGLGALGAFLGLLARRRRRS